MLKTYMNAKNKHECYEESLMNAQTIINANKKINEC